MSKKSNLMGIFKIKSQKKVTTLMKCGHVANGEDRFGKPICLICIHNDKNANLPSDSLPDLTDRQAICLECGKIVQSSFGLVFFEHRPIKDTDTFYCGCEGWE